MENNEKDIPEGTEDLQETEYVPHEDVTEEAAKAFEAASKQEEHKVETEDREESRPLNDEELIMLRKSVSEDRRRRRRLARYDNSDKAKFFRFIQRHQFFSAMCILLSVLIIIFSATGTFLVVEEIKSRPNTSDFTVILGDGKYTKKTTHTIKYSEAMRNGVLYVDMFKIAEYADLSVSGTKTSVKFTSNKDNYLRFEDQSNDAVINGSRVELGGKSVVNSEVCYVPYEFLTKAVGDTVRFTLDPDTNTIKIERKVMATDKKNEYKPLEVLFHTDNFDILVGIQRVEKEYNYEYSLAADAYLSSIAPKNAGQYLILANKQTHLGADYAPTDLKELTYRTDGETQQLRNDAAIALEFMMMCMAEDGITDIFVTSSYRSYDRQKTLWEGYVNDHMQKDGLSLEEAEARAGEYSARPGTSEHQTGLCVDFTTKSLGGELNNSFEYTRAFEWLSNNAYKFGFILRYPSDKVDTTEYSYESWHYRFVGREAATEIYLSGLCFEEYLKLN